jgi:16S rRNA (uracil1498-N3)-methyltransferase
MAYLERGLADQAEKPEGRFYLEGALSAEVEALPAAEAAHAFRARRLKPGCLVEVFNGQGASRRGVLEGDARAARVRFREPIREHRKPACSLTLAVSPPKGDRMTFLVEKLSELDGDVLIPTLFRRSLDSGLKADTSKITRWRRTAVESAKQCGRYHLLDVKDTASLDDLIPRLASFQQVFLLQRAEDAESLLDLLQDLPAPARTVLLLAGPQGGLTGEETARLKAEGARPACLGPRTLRIETAALAAAAVIRAEWDRTAAR